MDANISTIALIVAIVAAVSGIVTAILNFKRHRSEKRNIAIAKDSLVEEYTTQIINDATKYYIKPLFSSVDLTFNTKDVSDSFAVRSDLFDAADTYIKDDTSKFLLILAESGMGKTSFSINYLLHMKTSLDISDAYVIALGLPGADKRIKQSKKYGAKIIILDALDEDPKAIGRSNARLHDLLQKCSFASKVIVTSRTQFFESDHDIPRDSRTLTVGPTSLRPKDSIRIQVVYISPFTNEQVKSYLDSRFKRNPTSRAKAEAIVSQIKDLSLRPMILSYINDIVDDVEISESINSIYGAIADSWLKRESRWVEPNKLLYLSQHAAEEMYNGRESRGGEFMSRDELVRLAKKLNIDLEIWQIAGRSLLNRDGLGRLKFAHRSFMEYFYVLNILSDKISRNGRPLTGNMTLMLLSELDTPHVIDIDFKYSIARDHEIRVFNSYIYQEYIFGEAMYKTKAPKCDVRSHIQLGVLDISVQIRLVLRELSRLEDTIRSEDLIFKIYALKFYRSLYEEKLNKLSSLIHLYDTDKFEKLMLETLDGLVSASEVLNTDVSDRVGQISEDTEFNKKISEPIRNIGIASDYLTDLITAVWMPEEMAAKHWAPHRASRISPAEQTTITMCKKMNRIYEQNMHVPNKYQRGGIDIIMSWCK